MKAAPPRPVVRGHLSRAARVAAVAAIGVACGGTTVGADAGADGAADSSSKDSSVKDAVDDLPVAAYGGPFDSGQVQDAGATDAKQDVPIVPPYGQPVPPPPPPEPD